MAVGRAGSTDGLKVENFSSGKWNKLADYPYASSYIAYYSTVTFNEDMLIFGKFLKKYILEKLIFIIKAVSTPASI